MLDAGLQQVGGLEEEGGEDARPEAGSEVEDCALVSMVKGAEDRASVDVLGAAARFGCCVVAPLDIAVRGFGDYLGGVEVIRGEAMILSPSAEINVADE